MDRRANHATRYLVRKRCRAGGFNLSRSSRRHAAPRKYSTIISPGEKVHIASRPLFEEDTRRHFVGEVVNAEGGLVRARGYVFVLSRSREQFHRLPELRIRIFGFEDARLIVNVVPADTDIGAIDCRVNDEARLVVTDGKSFSLDIHEFYEARSQR